MLFSLWYNESTRCNVTKLDTSVQYSLDFKSLISATLQKPDEFSYPAKIILCVRRSRSLKDHCQQNEHR